MSRLHQIARNLRRRQTVSEEKLWRALRGRRFECRKFRRQHPIAGYIVDFACIEARLVIEVDGETHSTPGEVRRDLERTQAIEAAGYMVVRVSNHEVRTNMPSVLDTIWLELNRTASP
jgi:very-short-patch-repair endonuclease